MLTCGAIDFALFCIAALCFTFTIGPEFTFDDNEAILNNRDVNNKTSVITLFKHDFWGTDLSSDLSHKSFRPLAVLTFRLLKDMNGDKLNAQIFHVINITLHGLICVLLNRSLLAIFIRLHPSKCERLFLEQISFMTSMMFAVHPIHCEPVCTAVGLADLMSALFALTSIICFSTLKNSSVEAFFSNSFLVLLLSITSMLYKEQGITVLGMCCAIELIVVFPKYHKIKYCLMQPLKLFWFRIVILLCGCALIVLIRCYVMNFKAPVFHEVDNPSAFVDSMFFKILNYNYIYALNIWIIIHPLWLCFDWSMGCVPLISSLHDFRLLAIVVFWFSLLTLTYYSICLRSTTLKSLLRISIVFIVIPFVPSSNLFFTVGFVIAERSLYLSSIGFCLLSATGCQILSSINRSNKFKSAFYCLCVLFAFRSVQRSSDWMTEKKLFLSALDVCPLNAKVHYNIAKLAADNGDTTTAIQEYKNSLKLYENYYFAMNNLANILKDMNRTAEAELLLLKAVTVKSDFPVGWMNLGIVHAAMKKYAEAESDYLTALKFRKKYTDCMFNLGNLYLEQKRFQEAILMWKTAVSLKPSLTAAWINLILLMNSNGNVQEALTTAREALSFVKNDSSLHFNHANILAKVNNFEDAEKEYVKAINLREEAVYFANLGVLYHRWNKLEKAKKTYEYALKLNPNLKTTKDNINILMNLT